MSELLKFDDSIEHYEDVASEVAAKFLKAEYHETEKPSGPRGEPPDTPGYQAYCEYWFDGDVEVTLYCEVGRPHIPKEVIEFIHNDLFYRSEFDDEMIFVVDKDSIVIEHDRERDQVFIRFEIIDIGDVKK